MAVCIFCASSPGKSIAVQHAVERMGQELAERGICLVYGGGRVGLMGILADAVLRAGGEAVGVIPHALVERELAHPALTALHIVDTMHDRKLRMAELSDGFIALPGGAGTLEEIFEQWTWAQLGIHQKPCGFLNVEGFFEPLLQMISRIADFGYLSADHERMLIFEEEPSRLITAFEACRPPSPKWKQSA